MVVSSYLHPTQPLKLLLTQRSLSIRSPKLFALLVDPITMNSDKERCISCDNYSPTGSDIFVFIVMFFVFVLVSFVIFVKLCSSYVSPSMRRALTERFSNTFVFPEDLDELYNLADGQAVGRPSTLLIRGFLRMPKSSNSKASIG